jgi:hypothetical protein
MEADGRSYETYVNFDHMTWRQISEDDILRWNFSLSHRAMANILYRIPQERKETN